MDQALQDFVRDVADSDTKKDLILYFHDNPAIDSPRGLSVWINRSAPEISAEIDALVKAGILQRHGSGESAVYRYAPTPAQRTLVDQFVAYYKSDRRAAEDELATLRHSLADLAESSLRELQREQSQTKAIVASMADGVIVTDAQQVIVLYNPAAARLIGLDGGSGLGLTVDEWNPDAGVQQLARSIREALASDLTMIATEIELQRPRPIPLRAHLSAVRDQSGPLGVVTVLRDITDVKQADEQRVAFIHMVAHELRSPLTSIRGFVQSLRRGMFGDVQSEQKEPLEIVEQQTDRLLELINDLLEMASLEIGKKELKLQPVSLKGTIEDVVRVLSPQAEEKNHTITINLPENLPSIDADREALEHVFTNLITNAIKYTPPGGSITVLGKDLGEHAQVAVTDTGIGIPEAAIPKLFSRFFRVKDPKMREVTGTGLGLAIARNYVEAHMGTIEVATAIDRGSTFTVTLPKRQERRRTSEVEARLEQARVSNGEW